CRFLGRKTYEVIAGAGRLRTVRGAHRRTEGTPTMAAAVFFLILLTSVAIHEAGHLGAALATGMKVEKYYVGMGPKAFSRQVRGVEVGLRWLPIGGYVKIPGMDLRRAE